MTSAPPHAIRRRRYASLLVLSALSAAWGCKGSADGRTTARAAGRSQQGSAVPPVTEVVISATPGRYEAGAATAAATVSGVASVDAPLAARPPLPVGADSAVCGLLIADSSAIQSGAGLANVLVWLEGVRKGKPIPVEKRIEVESDHCRLVPRVQGAFRGGAVNVVGHDTFRQHLRFMAGGETTPRAVILLGKDEQVIPTELPLKSPGLVAISDQDHAWPRAFIGVFDHPYFTVTRADGSFTIDQVPAGSYTLVAWHERTGRSEQKVQVGAAGVVKVGLKLADQSRSSAR